MALTKKTRLSAVISQGKLIDRVPNGYSRTTWNGIHVDFNSTAVFDDGKNFYVNSVSSPQLAAPANLLAGLSWQPGASTTLSITGNRARATAGSAGVNPRIFKGPFQIQAGNTYRYRGSVYPGTSINNLFLRISLDSTIQPDGPIQEITDVITPHLIDGSWTAGVNTGLYIGLVAVVDNSGEYAEIDNDFSITIV